MSAGARWSGLLLAGLALACRSDARLDVDDADALPVLAATETLRLGSVEDPDVGFSSIADVAVDRDGLVYVLDSQADEVRVFDGARRVGTIGGGGGPGEFRSPGAMGLLGDTLWVIDLGRRVTLFERDGTVLTTWSLRLPSFRPLAGVGVNFLGLRLRPDRLIISTMMIGVSVSAPGETPTGSFVAPTLLLDSTGTAVDTLHWDELSLSSPSILVEGRTLYLPLVPSFTPWWRPSSDGCFAIDQPVIGDAADASFVVTRVRGARDTLYRTELRYRPHPFAAAVVDSLLGPWATESSRRTGIAADVIGAQARSALEIPPFLPPLSTAHVGADDMIWLRRQDDGASSLEWVLIDSAGRPSGRVHLPRNVMPRWSRGSTVWAVLTDDLDVPWLLRYELSPAEAS